MARFFQKLKKQKSRNSTESELQSPPVTSSVGTQSEPLPASFHLDGLLNSSGSGGGLRRQRSGVVEEVDGAMFCVQPPLEGRGGQLWQRTAREDLPSDLSKPLHLPPPLIPSPPFTLSRSTTPAQQDTSHESHHFSLATPTSRQLGTTPSHSTPSPTFPAVSGGQKNSPTFTPVSSIERSSSHRQNSSAVQTSSTPTGRPDPPSSVEDGDGEEVRRCRAALQALELREKRLMTEVADLRTELRASSCGVQPTPSPHPEAVVAELEESLRQAEETVQAVQGERDDLREGVEKMKDELTSLQRSNSLLARRKQQWMEVASQTRVVLEENHNLMHHYKAQQITISELRTQHHTRVAELEGELAQMNEVRKTVEQQMEQLVGDQVLLFHQISRLLGVSVSQTDSHHNSQHVASLLERYDCEQRRELAAWQEQAAYLEREKQVLTRKVEEAMAVTKRLEGELGQVQKVVQEGEETVARLREQLEELQEREEATQLQLAHALAQVDKAMSERDIYARAAKRWQALQGGETTKALDEARHQLRVQATEHRAQVKHYRTEIRQLKSLLSQDNSTRDSRRHGVSGKQKPNRDK